MIDLGIDLSEHNLGLPEGVFDRLRAHGCRFAFFRASRGDAYIDPTLPTWLALALARGWEVGAYHFMESASDGGTGAVQAEEFLTAIGDRFPDGSLMWLDVEQPDISWLQVVEFVERLRRAGLGCGLYSRELYWTENFPGRSRALFDRQWMASYDKSRNIGTWDLYPHPDPEPELIQFGLLKVPFNEVVYQMDGNLWRRP